MRIEKKTLKKKGLLSAILLAALVSITVTPVRAILFENRVIGLGDAAAEKFVDDALKRALAAFALGRATNAVISVIQETEIEASPAGVGVSIALGQVLDPVNDLVERFSWVMLVALTSLGIQKFLIEISPWLSIQVLAVLALILWLAGLWLGKILGSDLSAIARRLLLLAVVVRFAVPLMVWVNHQVYESFLAARYAQASEEVEQGTNELKGADPSTTVLGRGEVSEKNLWQRLKRTLAQAEETLDFRKMLDWVKGKSARLIGSFLDLIVVFLLNTVLLPVAFLWGLLRLFQALTTNSLPPKLEGAARGKIAVEGGEKSR